MAFWGTEFIFDDIPCSEFGLMVYHFGSNGQDDVSFKNGEIIEDRIPGRYDALTYGLVQNQSLEYTLVFGANMESLDANANLDRFEVEAIAAWLTGHSTRNWLVIVQDDMEPLRYKCTSSELKLICASQARHSRKRSHCCALVCTERLCCALILLFQRKLAA